MTYINPDAKTKPCPCGRGKLYTGHMSSANPVLDGRQVCQECVVEALYAKFFNEKED